jgi:hypothetical protein
LEHFIAFVFAHIDRALANLFDRLSGPANFRFVLQPVVSLIFAVRSGLLDARMGRPPYFWAIFITPDYRLSRLREGWKDVGKVFIVAIVVDLVYQIMVLRWFYPGEALLVAALLAFVPYLVFRGAVNRLARSIRRK